MKLKHTLLLLVMSCLSQAQIFYSHYLDETSEWREYAISSGGVLQLHYTTYYFDGTQDYNGYTYYRRFYTLRTDSYYNVTDFFSSYDSGLSNLVREDDLGNFYSLNPNTGVESVFFQSSPIASAQVGDSFPVLPFHTNDNCAIEAIEIVNISGLSLKHIMSYLGNQSGPIEGIGDIGPYCMTTLDGGGGINCYTKQGQTIQFGNADCSMFPSPLRQGLNNTTFDKAQVSVYPNPAKNIVNIKSENQISSVTVFDIQGRQIQTKIVDTAETILDISNLQQGNYLLKITTGGKNITKKIFKQ